MSDCATLNTWSRIQSKCQLLFCCCSAMSMLKNLHLIMWHISHSTTSSVCLHVLHSYSVWLAADIGSPEQSVSPVWWWHLRMGDWRINTWQKGSLQPPPRRACLILFVVHVTHTSLSDISDTFCTLWELRLCVFLGF